MKKLICFAAALTLLLSLSACGEDKLPTETDITTAPATDVVTEAPTATSDEMPTEAPTQTPTEAPRCALTGQEGTLFRNSLGEVWLSVWVTVRNDGTAPLSLPPMDITASAGGSTVKTLSAVTAYPNVIASGETACYYDESRVDTDTVGAADLTFDLAAETAAEDAVVRYTVTDKTQLRDSVYGGLTLTGEIKNEAVTKSESMACVAAVLYGEDDAVLGVLYAYLSDPPAAGKTVSFTLDSFMLPADVTADAVTQIQTFAYPT